MRKGELLLQPDDHVESIYYLISGFIRMYSVLPNGNELTVTIFKPGSYIPLFLAVDESKNAYYYEAFTAIEVLQAPVNQVLKFLKSNTDVLFDATRRISVGLRGLVENLQYQLFGSVRHRLIATILMLSKRFGKETKSEIQITLPLTHQDIADLVGVARETISMEMKRLQKEQSITYTYKHIQVIHKMKLQQEIGMDTE